MHRSSPFVGYAGRQNTIQITRDRNGIVCRLNRSTYRFILLAMVLFGPVLTLVLGLNHESLNLDGPRWLILYIGMGMLLLNLFAWLFLLRHLIFVRRIEVPYSSGDILFFRSRTGGAVDRIHRGDIQRIEMGEVMHLSEGERTRNHTLSVVTHGAERTVLCVSTDRSLIRTFAEDLGEITGIEEIKTTVREP